VVGAGGWVWGEELVFNRGTVSVMQDKSQQPVATDTVSDTKPFIKNIGLITSVPATVRKTKVSLNVAIEERPV
jgi:hypothetical protein